ncbi:diphthine--ammonia ligase [Candidatus Bathyarchaeota archaeon]|nr:diphthine--ammonia ligase [Candidatus Bathyarchaeota archaeon]MBS7629325.1 diphthine--ammonia ligase [Candidatus Bathyarchaeota archaeon]
MIRNMRLAVLFSGGKDSCYTIMKAREQGYKVNVLITIIPRSTDSRLFHYPCVEFTRFQAEAMKLPISIYNIDSEGDYEVEKLTKHLSEVKRIFKIEGIASGALASRYQKSRFEDAAGRVGLKCFTPLWGMDPIHLLNEQLNTGMEAMIVAVAALGLGQDWLGRILDREVTKTLLKIQGNCGVNPVGEGGEYETFVLNAPIFWRRLKITGYRKLWFGDRGHIEIDGVEFE